MKKKLRLWFLGALPLCLAACSDEARFEEISDELEKTQSELRAVQDGKEKMTSRLQRAESRIAELVRGNEELAEENSNLRRELAAVKTRQDEILGELALFDEALGAEALRLENMIAERVSAKKEIAQRHADPEKLSKIFAAAFRRNEYRREEVYGGIGTVLAASPQASVGGGRSVISSSPVTRTLIALRFNDVRFLASRRWATLCEMDFQVETEATHDTYFRAEMNVFDAAGMRLAKGVVKTAYESRKRVEKGKHLEKMIFRFDSDFDPASVARAEFEVTRLNGGVPTAVRRN